MANIAARLDAAIKAVTPPIPIVGVSIGDPANKATWTVHPANLQSAAQPTIDAFNIDDPQAVTDAIDAETNEKLRGSLDHVIVALAELLPSVVTVTADYSARTFADTVRNRIIVLGRAPNTRPKKGG